MGGDQLFNVKIVEIADPSLWSTNPNFDTDMEELCSICQSTRLQGNNAIDIIVHCLRGTLTRFAMTETQGFV